MRERATLDLQSESPVKHSKSDIYPGHQSGWPHITESICTCTTCPRLTTEGAKLIASVQISYTTYRHEEVLACYSHCMVWKHVTLPRKTTKESRHNYEIQNFLNFGYWQELARLNHLQLLSHESKQCTTERASKFLAAPESPGITVSM